MTKWYGLLFLYKKLGRQCYLRKYNFKAVNRLIHFSVNIFHKLQTWIFAQNAFSTTVICVKRKQQLEFLPSVRFPGSSHIYELGAKCKAQHVVMWHLVQVTLEGLLPSVSLMEFNLHSGRRGRMFPWRSEFLIKSLFFTSLTIVFPTFP